MDFCSESTALFHVLLYGHVVGGRFQEIPRCGKCAGGHGTEDCVVSVDKVVRVNCRVAHVAGDRKCPVRERQLDVASLNRAEGDLC